MRYLLLLFCFPLVALDVGIAAIFRDEAPYLREWIEYHRLVGVEKFYLYNHFSQDNFRQMLAPYVKEGIVELIDWPYEVKERSDWIPTQTGAYKDATKRALGVCRWLAYIDVDEFIFPVVDRTLPRFLSHFEDAGSVAMNWLVFGTSGIKKLDPSKLMIEQLTVRASGHNFTHAWLKRIAKTEAVRTDVNWPSVHYIPLKKGFVAVDSNHQKLCDTRGKVNHERIRLNHYSFRDETFFRKTKLNRPNITPARKKELLHLASQANRVKDESILRYANELKRRIVEKFGSL